MSPTASLRQSFRIVCFGGSAGALSAYLEILQDLPADTGMAFVIVSHREPNHATLLARILSNATAMPVVDVSDGMRLSPNCIFLMPPGVEMRLSGERLLITRGPRKRGWPTTISIFLSSLAEHAKSRSVAVILSGDDGDGSSALGAIKAAGGVIIAQSDACHPDMPRAAFDTGHVDYMLSPSGIANELLALAT